MVGSIPKTGQKKTEAIASVNICEIWSIK